MSAFVSELSRLRDQYAAEEQELNLRIARDQERFSEVQTLRAACEALIKAYEAAPQQAGTDTSERDEGVSVREIVLGIITAKRGLGHTPADVYEAIKERNPNVTLKQIQTVLQELANDGGPIKYGEGHYYS